MWQRIALAITVVLLGFSRGVLALFVRGMQADRGAIVGFCFVCALAIVQAWMVASEIGKARRLCGSIRNACYRGAHAKFRAVSLVTMRNRGSHSHGTDCGRLGNTSPIRHCHVRWCRVFHCRSLDRAARSHCAGRGMKSVYRCDSLLWRRVRGTACAGCR